MEDRPYRHYSNHFLHNDSMSFLVIGDTIILLFIPIFPHCWNTRILQTVNKLEQDGVLRVGPKIMRANYLDQGMNANLKQQKDPISAKVLFEGEVGIISVVWTTVSIVVPSVEVCPGNWLGVVEVDGIVISESVINFSRVRRLLQFPVTKNMEKTERRSEEKDISHNCFGRGHDDPHHEQ